MSRRYETPDSWIERRDDDDGRPPMSDAELCDEGLCDHRHCDECGAIVEPGRLDYGICGVCDSEWRAAHQLGWTPPGERTATETVDVMNAILGRFWRRL